MTAARHRKLESLLPTARIWARAYNRGHIAPYVVDQMRSDQGHWDQLEDIVFWVTPTHLVAWAGNDFDYDMEHLAEVPLPEDTPTA